MHGASGLQAIFDERVSSIYRGMASRVGEKRGEGGRIVRPGRALPFTRSDLSAWTLACFESVDRAVPCAYCNAWLNVQTFCIDHEIPIAAPWHGSLGLENLALACASCNRRKGRMSAEGFRLLVSWALAALDRRDCADMLGRMANGGANLKVKLGRESHQNCTRLDIRGCTEPLWDSIINV